MNQALVGPQPFLNSTQHILAELERIDVLIRAQVMRARQIHKVDTDFQGLYISETEVDALLEESAGLPRWAVAPATISECPFSALVQLCNTTSKPISTGLKLTGVAKVLSATVRMPLSRPNEIFKVSLV